MRSAFHNPFELDLLEGVKGRYESVVKNFMMLLGKQDLYMWDRGCCKDSAL